jgi:hypothetical protein
MAAFIVKDGHDITADMIAKPLLFVVGRNVNSSWRQPSKPSVGD